MSPVYTSNNITKQYEGVFLNMLTLGVNDFVDTETIESTTDFLKYLVKEKRYLLHGSNNQNISRLEPRQAYCKMMKFGNQTGVYAHEDEILPIFYAIRDEEKAKMKGVTSLHTECGVNGKRNKEYVFSVAREFLDADAWSSGAIYILPRDTFIQGRDDNGNYISEWLSYVEVVPIGKIKVGKRDFPYLKEIKVIDEKDYRGKSIARIPGPRKTNEIQSIRSRNSTC